MNIENPERLIVNVKKSRPNARLPKLATAGSAAFDLFAALDAPLTIAPGEFKSVPTGICVELPGPAYVALVFARSGLAVKHGVSLVNGVGVIDSDYRGEIQVALINHSREPYTVNSGDRVAQLMVTATAAPLVDIVEQTELGDTDRGQGGFGSTGR